VSLRLLLHKSTELDIFESTSPLVSETKRTHQRKLENLCSRSRTPVMYPEVTNSGERMQITLVLKDDYSLSHSR